ncbi:interferon-induced GTP-binding protein Mx2 [Poronia punctata]|nr:interferon-induced GTP-binding protein Mx2 [Poronia punctata]
MSELEMEDQSNLGNHTILTKVDRLRELVGTKVALPQIVVVGDQSSGKSSVLENLTGFAFPRAAELCTRYATQITCRREKEKSISVSIMADPDAAPDVCNRVKAFHRKVTDLSEDNLAGIFRDANEVMGISTPENPTTPSGLPLPAFSQHVLKIEKQGPTEEHFTVIDVPGIFRKETEGLTRESDIELVMDMVKNYMRESRTIILAIIPSNVDPATQEILKLAKKVDPSMNRTMAVLTKPDLALEEVTKRIAIDYVLGKRGDLSLGYYIVKNRGADDTRKTLKQGRLEEQAFFNKEPWSVLSTTGRAGIRCLRNRVRELLIDLIRRELPKLKSEVSKALGDLRIQYDALGAPRNDHNAQRAYLLRRSEAFQSLTRDALTANYNRNIMFTDRPDLRLITRVVEQCESYSERMAANGHTRIFPESEEDSKRSTNGSKSTTKTTTGESCAAPKSYGVDLEQILRDYPELAEIFDHMDEDLETTRPSVDNIMDHIKGVYMSSRGQDLGTFGSGLLYTLFREQSRRWETLTLTNVGRIIHLIHRFISEAIESTCPDRKVKEALWNGHLIGGLMESYQSAMEDAKRLLRIEREGGTLTLNPLFRWELNRLRSNRVIRGVAGAAGTAGDQYEWADPFSAKTKAAPSQNISVHTSKLQNLSDKGDPQQVSENLHDVLYSYYKVARQRFVDVIYQQVVNDSLLFGEKSPFQLFSTDMVLGLDEDQLDMIAAEDDRIKQRREKLTQDINNTEEALNVLKVPDKRVGPF